MLSSIALANVLWSNLFNLELDLHIGIIVYVFAIKMQFFLSIESSVEAESTVLILISAVHLCRMCHCDILLYTVPVVDPNALPMVAVIWCAVQVPPGTVHIRAEDVAIIRFPYKLFIVAK